jgi:osmotically-inducible protein OsmY
MTEPIALLSDQQLVRRVRRAIHTLLRPPWHLSVTAADGRVRLTGAVLPEDLARLLDAVGHVDGVHHVEHHLA